MSTSDFEPPFNFISEVFLFPEQYNDDFRLQLRKYLNDIVISLNIKENGFYIENEVPTGALFIPTFSTDTETNAQYRPIFRKVVDFGALPNNSTKTVPHGISTTENYSVIHLYGVATQPGVSTLASSIPIPQAGIPNNDRIELEIDSTNVIITTAKNTRSDYTRTFVTIEYIKEI